MTKPRKCVFFDRDGVINRDYGYVYKQEDFVFNDGIFELLDFFKRRDFLLVVVTNQSGIARGYYTQQDLEILHNFMQEQLRLRVGFGFDKIYFCPHASQQNCQCRKPQIGMIIQACKDFAIDVPNSLFIGDKITDMQCAYNANVGQKFLLQCGDTLPQDLVQSVVHKVQTLAQIQKICESL